jgi:hypothetical protein
MTNGPSPGVRHGRLTGQTVVAVLRRRRGESEETVMDSEHVNDWHVVVHLYEDRTRTAARAVLSDGDRELVGRGEAHRSPYDSDVPRIGDELAAGRALLDLGQKLIRVTQQDIGILEGHPVR